MDQATKEAKLKHLNEWCKHTILEVLDITFTDITEDSLTATMPVTWKVHQPMGLMHGGASCVLAESLGSTLSVSVLDLDKYYAVGTNINSNHLKSATKGIVTGTARFIRKGATLHYSEIEIRNEKGELLNHTTMTNIVIRK
ncbi:PaaI family thioesterase [Soonwooa sp.]|uniref:PaaI family thioesterase n=1 Tax=Soonwooa sp. TaxID=1938592 RepID=UPI00261EC546|nr:PaaI family thioesterase [Soonwooa sp.]